MRKALFILLLIFSSYGRIYSETAPKSEAVESIAQKIKLLGKFGDKISRTPLPEKEPVEAYIENNKIIIYFNLKCTTEEAVTISVQNEYNQVVFNESYTLETPNSISFFIEKQESESYIIEISSFNGYLIGNF